MDYSIKKVRKFDLFARVFLAVKLSLGFVLFVSVYWTCQMYEL